MAQNKISEEAVAGKVSKKVNLLDVAASESVESPLEVIHDPAWQ